jgi:hypothetical protein
VYSRDPQGYATTPYNNLSITTTEEYGMTWSSPTKCYFQTIMTDMNSHERGMRPIFFINFSTLPQEVILYKKTSGVFGTPCVVRISHNQAKHI